MLKRTLFIALFAATGLLSASVSAEDQEAKPFHGVTVLASNIEMDSSRAGPDAIFEGKIGPYASDAVVLISSRGEFVYPGSWRQDQVRVVMDVSAKTLTDRWIMASTSSSGPESWPITYSTGDDKRIFIPKGEVRTLNLKFENRGDFDPKKAVATAIVHLTVLAANS